MYRIREVNTMRDLRKFISFPDELYRGCPQYVPALHSDQRKSLTSVSSLEYCTHRMWLAEDELGKIVGRICAMVNPRYNERYHTRRARFGWFDTIDSREVAFLLLGTAEKWAVGQGMDEIHGPLYYNTLGKQGMLVEGFENMPPFNCLYNYPYYCRLVEEYGFGKECDWVQYKVVADKGVPDKVNRVSEMLMQQYKLHFADIEKMAGDHDRVREFFRVYNDSFASSVYNFVPFTDKEIDEEAASVMPYLSNKSSCILLDENDEVVAFGISFPSISKALRKAHGHLFPFGWIHLLRALRNFETTDLMLTGAAPEWQNRGVSAIYYREMADKAIRIGNRWAVTNPQLENNSAVNLWNSYERELFMRRRCYIKKIK